MDTPAAKCTLHALFASASPKAVIYRRGPSKHTCLIAWDRSDDTFRVGQWFKGAVKPSWCGLSPNGEWLVSFLAKYRGPFGTWTNLSKPPYFTAVSLWPVGHTWSGGGWFLSDDEMVLGHCGTDFDLAPGFLPPPGLTVLPYGREQRPAIDRRTVSPWRCEPSEKRALWPGPHGHVLEKACAIEGPARWSRGLSSEEAIGHRILIDGGRPVVLPQAGWAAFDGNGDLLFSDGGRLYRLPAAEIGTVASPADLPGASRCLADFTDMTFVGIQAPYDSPRAETSALEEESPMGFAPPLDRRTREDRRAAKRLPQRAKREKLTEFR